MSLLAHFEMMNFMSMYFSIVKTEGVFYSVLLAKDTSVQPDTSSFFNFLLLYFFLFTFFLFTSSFLAVVPGLRWINLV